MKIWGEVELTKDPVCAMKADEMKAVSSSYSGKTYYFCSPNCKNEFDKNPTKYAT
jgi:YHS domain-containing protein